MVKNLIILFIIMMSLSVVLAEVVEAIVARVNNEVITLTQVKQVEAEVLKTLSVNYEGDELREKFEQMKSKIIDSLIEERLLIQKAKEKGIDVEKEVNDSIERLKKENNIRTNEELSEALKQEGLTIEDLKKQLRERTMQQKLLYYYLQGKISITEQEMKKYYDDNKNNYIEPASYRISHIFISNENRTEDEAYERAKQVLEKIKNGADFGEIAKEYSDDESREKGGDLGFLTRSELNPDLAKEIDSISIGQTSNIIKGVNGYHIFKVVEKVEARMKDYEEVKEDIYQKMFNERAGKYQDEFMEQLKKSSYIEIIYDPYKSK